MQSPSLLKAYRQSLAEHGFDADPAQEALVERLQKLLDELMQSGNDGWRFSGLPWFWKKRRGTPARGVYVWGDVGRGKTFLLNLFFRHLPGERKMRVHFHEFMHGVHARRAESKGTRDPLKQIARDFAARAELLYLDEFHVTDIGDAMILGELLKQLADEGVVFVMTSNCAPSELYRDGLQRQRFLPTIALIEEQLDVFELGARCDYRLQLLSGTNLYNTPADEMAERTLENSFRQLITETAEDNTQLRINDRSLAARKRAGGVVWFDFNAVCGGPCSSADYLEIARLYETVLLSNIPLFEDHDDLARRFINMIDTFYDCRVRFIASAADRPERLYRRGRLAREFRRTASRLIEMHSSNYITQAHGTQSQRDA